MCFFIFATICVVPGYYHWMRTVQKMMRRKGEEGLKQPSYRPFIVSAFKDPVLKWLINSKKTEYKTAAIKLSRVTMGN